MAIRYDAVIIGGGHNGLICGAYLAKAGKKVLVLERRHLPGGACVTEEVWPGFKVSTASYVMSMMQHKVIDELELRKFGFEVLPMEALFVPFPDGRHFVFWEDPKKIKAELAKFSKKDAERYPEFDAFLVEAAGTLREVLFITPPTPTSRRVKDIRGLIATGRMFNRLGDKLYRLMDLMTMSISDFLDMYFESEEIKGFLAFYAGIGTFLGPKSPGTAYVLLHHLMGDLGGAGGWGLMRGGMGAVPSSIIASASRWGMEVRTEAEVAQIKIGNSRATGVVLASGEEIEAGVVVSNADAGTTFLKLVGANELPSDFVEDIRTFRTDSSAFKINLALDGLPQYAAFNEEVGISYPTYVHIGPNIDYLEKAYDDAKYGRPSEKPFMTPMVPTIVDPELAPDGKHQMTIFGGHAPYNLRGTTWDEHRDVFADRVIETLAQYIPNLPDIIIDRQVLVPPDMERIYGLPHGHIFHGELALDQLFFLRPAPGYADYRSPIKGLYQCGSSTHPGGGVMGMGGHNAAREILKDLGNWWTRLRR